MDMQQFYPTPADLAEKMIGKFKASPFDNEARVLEPSAGSGALIEALVLACEKDRNRIEELRQGRHLWHRRDTVKVDFLEIDMRRHAGLSQIEGASGQAIGLDFLQFCGSLAHYTHVLMNPPFNMGVHHVLKAWDGLFDGEIVALLNAETIKNPFSKERKLLAGLIERHGDVEFVQDAFSGEGVEREANVEVAIVHLTKVADVQGDIVGNLLDSLKGDSQHETGGAENVGMPNDQELAIPSNVIDRTVRAFDIAVRAMRESVVAKAKAQYAARLVGMTLAQRNGEAGADSKEDIKKEIRAGIAKGYDELKDRAWSEVLRSTEMTSKLSSAAARRMESEFERIKHLDFSISNVYGFLIGLVDSQGEMNLQMMLDCFDEITKYHSDNAVWYMGWKSNDKHRTAGRRIKTTRFILPHFSGKWGSRQIDYGAQQRLRDFDKAFAILDGKTADSVFGLADLFNRDSQELAAGARLSCSYFDVRWYPGRGTIHFFPKRKDLVDRLNRVVGRARQWLPESDEMASKDFWLAYENAEKFNDAIVSEATTGVKRGWNDPFWRASRDGGDSADAQDRIARACVTVAQANGLDPTKGLEYAPQAQIPLLEAA